ncbi:MAG: CotH kinase family protein [Oscillospiraceae bacterium]|nr:CotH kinase family protein [Oscillospiraceae bacterium]
MMKIIRLKAMMAVLAMTFVFSGCVSLMSGIDLPGDVKLFDSQESHEEILLKDDTEEEKAADYREMFSGSEVLAVDILADEGDWQRLLDNATAKEWISADVVINGELFESVGIRTKGNSSLSGRGGRYSLQFRMDKFIENQSYFGLERFCVNNMMGDATYMKDYIAYDIMNFIGVDTPLTNYAEVKVNSEGYMFGVAIERYHKSFLERVYGNKKGHLYNVKIGMGSRSDFEGGFPGREQRGRFPDGRNGEIPDGFRGVGIGGMGDIGGGSLVYTNDEISSYNAIFKNNVFNKTDEEDNQRVITALKNLNTGTDLEEYIDVDKTLRYFAAHTVVVNLDSYVSDMAQNYYIYERKGKIAILPWDYNLAFGGFQTGNASDFVNFPINTPVSGVKLEDRPLLNKLLEIPENLDLYHGYLNEIVERYFESRLFEKTVHELDAKIGDYVKNDTSPYFTYQQYQESLPVFIELCKLRALSIRGQLDDTIPSTVSGQKADSSALIDCAGIDISKLGTMTGGGGRGGIPDFSGGFPDEHSGFRSMPDWGGEFPDFGDFFPPDFWEVPGEVDSFMNI